MDREDINGVTVGRDRVVEWIDEPGSERSSALTNCSPRVSIQPVATESRRRRRPPDERIGPLELGALS